MECVCVNMCVLCVCVHCTCMRICMCVCAVRIHGVYFVGLHVFERLSSSVWRQLC